MGNKFIRGALVEFRPAFGRTLPNVIVFQFNPETMTHAWKQLEGAGGGATATAHPLAKPNPLAVQGLPGESFSFSLMLDADESIAEGDPVSGPLAVVSGIYPRLAALEMLLYPVPVDVTQELAATTVPSAPGGGAANRRVIPDRRASPDRPVPENQLPTVLFAWGPGRIVPVRLTDLSITERLYNALLSPTHAEATVTLRVLTTDELNHIPGPMSSIAQGAYTYTQKLREALSLLNLGSAGESVVGMLPFGMPTF